MLDWNVMKNWPPILWAIFIALIVFLAALIRFVVKVYMALHIIKWFVLGLGIFGAWFYYKSRGATDIHIHHYVLGSFVTAICSYQDWFITGISGLFSGITIDGLARWGMDPIFEYAT